MLSYNPLLHSSTFVCLKVFFHLNSNLLLFALFLKNILYPRTTFLVIDLFPTLTSFQNYLNALFILACPRIFILFHLLSLSNLPTALFTQLKLHCFEYKMTFSLPATNKKSLHLFCLTFLQPLIPSTTKSLLHDYLALMELLALPFL